VTYDELKKIKQKFLQTKRNKFFHHHVKKFKFTQRTVQYMPGVGPKCAIVVHSHSVCQPLKRNFNAHGAFESILNFLIYFFCKNPLLLFFFQLVIYISGRKSEIMTRNEQKKRDFHWRFSFWVCDNVIVFDHNSFSLIRFRIGLRTQRKNGNDKKNWEISKAEEKYSPRQSAGCRKKSFYIGIFDFVHDIWKTLPIVV